MQEYTTQEGYKIYVFANAIPKDVCESWIPRFPTDSHNCLRPNPSVSEELYGLLRQYVNTPFPTKGHQGHVSFARLNTPVSSHYDGILENETHKVVFYLNEVANGGTEFKSGNDWLLIEAHQGTVVIFDMRLYHRGQQTKGDGVKYIMGFRLIEDKGL